MQNRNYLYLLLGLFFCRYHQTPTRRWQFTWAPFLGADAFSNWVFDTEQHLGRSCRLFLAARLHHRFDKRWTIALSAIGLSVFWSMTVNLALLGLAPANSSWALVAFIIFWNVLVFFGAVLNISVMSALADIADEHELKTGLRLEGIFYSRHFCQGVNARACCCCWRHSIRHCRRFSAWVYRLTLFPAGHSRRSAAMIRA